jgi:hypothetical protein
MESLTEINIASLSDMEQDHLKVVLERVSAILRRLERKSANVSAKLKTNLEASAKQLALREADEILSAQGIYN